MGKMLNALLLTSVLELTMAIFYHQTSGTSLFTLLTNPSAWANSLFLGIWNNNLILALGTIGIIAGLYYIRNDFIFYVAIGGILLTFGATIYEFWQWIYSQTALGDMNLLVATILVSPLAIYYVLTTSDFMRGRD